MSETFQMEGLTILEHGNQVWYFYQKLINNDIEGMKIPKWFNEYQEKILENLFPLEDIELYTIYHDIGKTRCGFVDESGRKHFPNHAYISSQMWIEFGGNYQIANLMELDMIFHTETAEQIINRNLDTNIICTLLLAALAELHANANMFGGIKSESFCIKYKKLEQRAKKVLNHYFKGNKNVK